MNKTFNGKESNMLMKFYKNKHILITGATGFIGKVILYKLLDAIPDIGKIYLLIREKKGELIASRYQKEIVQSPCFDKFRNKPNFDMLFTKLIIPIHGDIIKENLDLLSADEELLLENVQIVINSAASVDFKSPLDEAININVKGPLHVYDLVRRMKLLESFVHISTAFVNCHLTGGFIEEKIYDIIPNPEEYIEKILKLTKPELLKQTKHIIGNHPNTYTFTKSMSERIMNRRNQTDHLPIIIIRPSIVGSSYRDPIPGWIDTVSACGALMLFSGTGYVNFLPGNMKLISDQIPVDYVVDLIIVAVAFFANQKKVNVLHSTSSSKNPTTFKIISDTVKEYFTKHSPKKKVGKPGFVLIQSKIIYDVRKLIKRIPFIFCECLSKVIKTKNIQNKANELKKIVKRDEGISEAFGYFTSNQWIFETRKVNQLMNNLTIDQNTSFQLNVKKIDWRYYFYHFNYGIQKFILKENVETPSQKEMNIIKNNKNKKNIKINPKQIFVKKIPS